MQTADFRTYAEAKPRTRALRGPDGGGCWHAWWQTQPRGDITHDGTGRGGAQGACNHRPIVRTGAALCLTLFSTSARFVENVAVCFGL